MKPRTIDGHQEVTDLTACRALFAAWVFAYHVDLHAQFAPQTGLFANFIHQGYLGVDGFFILSGLILTRVHPELGKSTSTYRQFWLRRLARIYPVHLAVIILLGVFVLIGAAMGAAPRDPTRFGLVGLAENLSLTQGLGFGNPWTWNYPSWTVSTEMAGYLAFPWLSRGYNKLGSLVAGQVALCCVPALGILSANTGHGLNIATGWPLLRFFLEFWLGIQAGRMVPMAADYVSGRITVLAGLGLALLGLHFHGDLVIVLGLWTVLFGLTMNADAEKPPLLRWLPFLRPLGLLSYAFYMSFATSELLLAQAFRHAGWDPAANKLLYAALMTGLTFAIAVVLHVLVENPCRKFADRRLAGPPKKPRRGPGDNQVPGVMR